MSAATRVPSGAEYLVAELERRGVEVVFGHPGGAIMPFYDALRDSSVRHVLVRHEQGAAFAADGYARATGRVGVCVATSGPGATNLLTGLVNAHMDSIPLVAITGQVPVGLIGTDAFQEVDILGMTLPVVKHAFQPTGPDELAEMVEEAFRLAAGGRPGPVLLDLPKDVLQEAMKAGQEAMKAGQAALDLGPGAPGVESGAPDLGPGASDVGPGASDPGPAAAGAGRPPAPPDQQVARAERLLHESRRPLLYAGGGIVLGGLVDDFRHFAETTGAPVVATLKGLGAVPVRHRLFLGMMGMHGARAANEALAECDLLVCVGARFDDRATGRLDGFAPEARVIHMDVDPGEVGKLRRVDAPILGDLRPALRRLAAPLSIDPWRSHCLERKASLAFDYDAPTDGVFAPRLLRDLSEALGDRAIVVCDVGQHQMWVAQHWAISRPERHLSSGGLGAMGYGLPAAVGALFGEPGSPVVNVTGDGSFMMNVQELATVARYELPLKIVVIDNSALGLVRQWQKLFFDRRFSEVDLSDNPDFVQVAAAFGVPGLRVDTPADVPGAIARLAGDDGPLLLHVPIDPESNVWPLVKPGASNSEMLESEAGDPSRPAPPRPKGDCR